MINKIIKIRGIGLLHDAISPAKKFSKITTIYGENGRGKTTFVNIFSSLTNNNPSLISVRKTLDGGNSQEVELRINETNYYFTNNAWSQGFEHFIIFDSSFVDANVYSGFNVSSDQRKSLLEFTLGETGVQLKNDVDELTKNISNLTSAIGPATTTIAHIASPYHIKTYLEIEIEPEIDSKIQESEKIYHSVKNADEICKKPHLNEFEIISFDFEAMQQLLATNLSEISETAKRRVIDHMNSHMTSSDEGWIKDGLDLIKTGNCPFCGQNLKAVSELIELYQNFFDESYIEYQENLKTCHGNLEQVFSSVNFSHIESVETNNISIFENVWKDLVSSSYNLPPVQPIIDSLHDIRDDCIKIIEIKLANPTLKIDDYSKFITAKEKFDIILSQLEQNNNQIQKINQEIVDKKKELKLADLTKIQNKLHQLKIVKNRHTSPNKEICEEYESLTNEKIDLEAQKTQAKDSLVEYTNTILSELESEINRHLDNFGAGYHIVNVTTSHEKGYPRINYKLQLRDQNLELGSITDALKKPVFSNSLSEGDKRTLAFAFFLAKTHLEPSLNKKIIIVDDPMSSLDQSRQLATQIALKKLASMGKQLVVLSHDPRFLQDFIDNSYFNPNEVTSFELQRCHNDYSTLKECNLEELIQSGYKKNFKIVSNYVSDGQCEDKYAVVRAIRPLIEANLRYRLQSSLQNADNLGKMIGFIRDSQPSTLLYKAKPTLPQLTEINIYTTRYSHGTDNDGALPPIIDAELKQYATLALNLIHGFN
jgi:wobble nucleotide-excising tRNase